MNYAGIARQIEIAASPYFFGLNQITLEIIGGILLLLGILGILIRKEIEKNKKKIILLSIFLIITGFSIGTLGSYSILSPKNFKNAKVIKILKKNRIENIDPEKLVKNLKTIEQMDPTIPIKYKTCAIYFCSYDYDDYYSAILSDYYNNRNDKVELYQKLEK